MALSKKLDHRKFNDFLTEKTEALSKKRTQKPARREEEQRAPTGRRSERSHRHQATRRDSAEGPERKLPERPREPPLGHAVVDLRKSDPQATLARDLARPPFPLEPPGRLDFRDLLLHLRWVQLKALKARGRHALSNDQLAARSASREPLDMVDESPQAAESPPKKKQLKPMPPESIFSKETSNALRRCCA